MNPSAGYLIWSYVATSFEVRAGRVPWTSMHSLWGHRHGDDAVGEQRRRDRLVKLGVVSRLVRKRRLVAEQGRVEDPRLRRSPGSNTAARR